MRKFTAVSALLILVFFSSCHKEETIAIENTITPNDFLSSKKYDKLIVEIQYVTGNAPTQATLDNLQAFLQQRLNKPSGISIVQNAIASPGKASFSVTDVQNIEKGNRTQTTNGKTLAAYFLFADGEYSANSGNSKVLGFAYGRSSMAIFEKTVRDLSGSVGQPSSTGLESTVLLHEFGHILGLVNNGTSMQTPHEDGAHAKHCNDQNCLMYYNVETSDVVANMVGSNIPTLNANCLSDLAANDGR